MAAEVPATVLQDAITAYSEAERHWAFEQRVTEYNRRGEPRSIEVTRVDPSRPWDERDILLATEKGPASARQKEQYQKRRAKELRQDKRGLKKNRRLRDRMNFPLAELVAETPDSRIYAVPLLPDESSGFAMHKVQVQVALAPHSGQLQWIEAKLLEAVRVKAVAKVKTMALKIEFSRPLEAEAAPALLRLQGHAVASVLFIPIGGEVHVERTFHRWVTPYDDRFNVEFGTPTAIDF